MILTVTLNAAVDKLYLVGSVNTGTVMRVQQCVNTAGGKGLNVSKVAVLAGEEVCATGFLGGFSGQYVRALLKERGIRPLFAEVAAETRSCINIRDTTTGRHTEFLEPGAGVTPQEVRNFEALFEEALPQCDVVTISGSVPEGVPVAYYGGLVRRAKEAGKPIIVDTSGALLQAAAEAWPTMVKPNEEELAQLLGHPVGDRQQLVQAAQELHQKGIAYVVVSLGKEGALLVCRQGIYQGVTPDVPVVNTVGCGDSMVAAFAVGLARGYGPEKMLHYAMAVSTANAMSVQTGHFEQAVLDELMDQVQVQEYVP